MKLFMLSMLLVLSPRVSLHAQEAPDYFPTSVGNTWEYTTAQDGVIRFTIVRDSTSYYGDKFLFYDGLPFPLHSLDSSGLVHYAPLSLNWILYKLDADSGETWMVHPEDTSFVSQRLRQDARVQDIYELYVFGSYRLAKEILYYDLPLGDTCFSPNAMPRETRILVDGVGEYYKYSSESGPQWILNGCIINGITLGYLSEVQEFTDHPPVATDILLNYPNPFNATTRIRFDIASSTTVELKIYSSIGLLIETILDGPLERGSYSFTFSPPHNLSSGIYFIMLRTAYSVSRGKMIYLK